MPESNEQHLLAKPLRKSTTDPHERNIFASLNSKERLPNVSKLKGKTYHVIGSKEFRKKILQPEQKPQQITANPQNQTFSNTFMNTTTINRQTIVSKINHQQQNILSREGKQINRYKEYKTYWDEQNEKLKRKTVRKPGQKTLLENNVRGLYVHENQDKIDVVNNFVVNYWEMSLRNNNRILERHIKGNRFDRVQLEELLQTDRGTKKVEKSIPNLPLEKLKNTERTDLSLSGRSKAFSQTNALTTRKFSLPQSQTQEEVFRVNYTGDLKWMSTEGL